MSISHDQAYAYAEILEILSFTHISLTSKIPKKLISIIKENALSTYEHHLDRTIPLENQNISSETATLITLLSLNYWCESEEEKKELKAILSQNEKIKEEELRKKYSYENIFNNQKSISNSDSSIVSENKIKLEKDSTNLPFDTTTLPWFQKIIIKLKDFFQKIKNK